MSRYDSYQSNAAEAPLMRKWLLNALIGSLLLHGGLFAFFHTKKLENFGPPATERLSPPVRVFKRVAIPEIPKDPEEVRLTLDKVPKPDRLALPTEKPEVKEVRLSPQAPDMPKPLLNDKPKADAGGADLLAKVEAASRGQMEKELNSLAGSLLKESPKSPRQPVLTLPPSSKPGDGALGDREGIPGMRSIDDALASTGPLPAGDKPIGMPGGALYEYNSAELRPEAVEQLLKLGELIRRNPKATFSIEGHADSLGDPVYNQTLSEQRAAAVRDWLMANMRIAPERIQTKGFGSSKMIIAPKPIDPGPQSFEAEKARQAPNRRVEIVIKTNRK